LDIKGLLEDNRLSGSVCLAICVGLLLIGLWPLDFSPGNEVWWLKDINGLHFHGSEIAPRFSAGGVAYTPNPLISLGRSRPVKGEISVELWLRPAADTTRCWSRIVVFCDDLGNQTLLVGQRKTNLIVGRVVYGPQGKKSYRKIDVKKVLLPGKVQFVTIILDESGTSIYVKGNLAGRFPDFRLIEGSQSISGQSLLIGNSPEATCSWAGDILGLAIYDRALTEAQVFNHFQWWTQGEHRLLTGHDGVMALYPFSEGKGVWAHNAVGSNNHLLIPSRLHFKKRILVSSEFYPHSVVPFLKDAIVNVFGFIPFGFFLPIWLIKARKLTTRRTYLVVIVAGVFISLTIELLQVYLPARTSSQTDLMFNTMGTILGVALFHYAKEGLVISGRAERAD